MVNSSVYGLLIVAMIIAQFRTGTETVEVPVTVLHKRNPVAGLAAADFRLLEDGKPVKITDASVDSRPLDVTLLVDTSESAALSWTKADAGIAAAAARVQRLLRPDDTLAIYRFAETSERVGVDAPPVTPRGQTAIFDTILETLLEKPRSARSITIALTDGLDTASLVPRGITRAVADRSDAVIHVVVLSLQTRYSNFGYWFTGDGFSEFSKDLSDLATRTGGRFLVVDKEDAFIPTLAALLEQARTRYYLRYTPPNVTPGWHDLEVSTTVKGHEVTHRRGYWRPR